MRITCPRLWRSVLLALALVVGSVEARAQRDITFDLPPLPDLGVPPFTETHGAACDRLAADYNDMQRAPGATPFADSAIEPDRAVSACEAAAKAAPDEARYTYQYGRALEARQDDVSARQAYRRASERGHAMATLALSRLLRLGRGGPADHDAAYRLVAALAATEHPGALALLANHYRHGVGSPHDLDRWIDALKRAAAAGSVRATRDLAVAYRDGVGVARTPELADDLFQTVAEQARSLAEAGDAYAMWMLGMAYETGAGVTGDLAEAVVWYRRVDVAGHYLGRMALGSLYARGAGVAHDSAKACDLYERAAMVGEGIALTALARCFITGTGRGRDVVRGLALLERSVATGDGEAARALGRLYEAGDGVPRDRLRARDYYGIAISRGHGAGMLDYANLLQGEGPKGQREACDWYERAAERNSARAMNNLAACYGNEQGGRPRDVAAALRWYEQAAERGDGLALRNLGDLHLNGVGVERDAHKALAFYLRGARADDVGAMVELGMMYTRGVATAVDAKVGCDWFERAAQRGSNRAMNNIGACYANGEGRATDLATGIVWYRRAVDAGDAVAMANLGDLYANGRGVARDQRKAVGLFKQAAEAGYAGGAVELAVALYHGNGIDKDPEAACRWYEKAAADDYAAGLNGLGVCLEFGIGRKRDLKAATVAFTRAADAGSITALRNLIRFTDRGIGGPRDPEAAADWMRKAFERGHDQLAMDMMSYPSGWHRDSRRALQRVLKRAGLYGGPIDGYFNAALDGVLWDRLLRTGDGDRLVQSFVWAPVEGASRGLLVRICEPARTDGTPRPLAILNHGLTTDDAERRDMRPLACGQIARFFTDRGYTVAIPLRRGYGETGGRFLEGGTRVCSTSPDFVGPGLAIAADIQATITHLSQRPGIATVGMLVVGHSGGGWGALALASRNTPEVAGIVNISGVHGSNRNRPDGVCGPEPIAKSTRTFGKSARQPTLWIYAENDSHAGPRLVRRMFDGFRREGGNGTLVVLPAIDSDGHNIFDDDSLDLWSGPLEEWMQTLKR